MPAAAAWSVTRAPSPPSVSFGVLGATKSQPCLGVWSLLMWTFQEFRGQSLGGGEDTLPGPGEPPGAAMAVQEACLQRPRCHVQPGAVCQLWAWRQGGGGGESARNRGET